MSRDKVVPTPKQIALLQLVAENMPFLAKGQTSRELGRYHESGGERYLTFFGFMEQVAHKKGAARFAHPSDRRSIVRCLNDTYGLSRQQLWAFYHAAQAVRGIEKRAEIMERHVNRVLGQFGA